MSEAAAEYRSGLAGDKSPPMTTRLRGWRRCSPAVHQRSVSGASLSVHPLLVREASAPYERRLPESLLHSAWRRAGDKAAVISGRDGHTYRVVYSGRPAGGTGPDFRDALLLRDDGLRIHGHVEIHVRSGDWHSHGHGSDSAYNGVVLHVALEESGPPVTTDSGMRIPLLILKREHVACVEASVEGSLRASEVALPGPVSAIPLPLLDMAAAGDRWFENRSHGRVLQIASEGADQALWEGALECLGFPSNKKGFRQLANRLNWNAISEIAVETPGFNLNAVIAWAAGFEERPDGSPGLVGRKPEWRVRHGRPANNPRTRLAAIPEWALRWQQAGGPARAYMEAVGKAEKPGDLGSVFAVAAQPGRSAPAGASRAADAVVNHLLPSVYALATSMGQTRLADRARNLFEKHRPLQSNSITREASRMLRGRGVAASPRTAREQQGLIHIYRMATAAQRQEQQLPLL